MKAKLVTGCYDVGRKFTDPRFVEDPTSLSEAQLLSVLLGGGSTAVERGSGGLGEAIINHLSQHHRNPIEALRTATVEELCEIPGIGPVKANQIVAAIQLGKRILYTPTDTSQVVDDPTVAAALFSEISWRERENFAVLVLDVRHRVKALKIVSQGTATEALASPREIFQEVIRYKGQRCIVGHNHPSGNLSPSPEDIKLTKQIVQAGQHLDINVLDHIIVGGGDFKSLRQTTTIWQELGATL